MLLTFVIVGHSAEVHDAVLDIHLDPTEIQRSHYFRFVLPLTPVPVGRGSYRLPVVIGAAGALSICAL